jgi:hypothetical protein
MDAQAIRHAAAPEHRRTERLSPLKADPFGCTVPERVEGQGKLPVLTMEAGSIMLLVVVTVRQW